MKNTRRLPALHAAFLLSTTCVFAGEPAAPVKPTTEKFAEAAAGKPATSSAPVVTEAAKSDFPYTLQGVFGLPGQADASLRAIGSDESVWVKPGKKIGGWTLVGVDPVNGVAVLSMGARRVTLRLAGSKAGSPGPDSGATEGFNGKPLVFKKLDALRQKKDDRKVYDFMVEAESKTFELMKKTHPQFIRVDGASTELLIQKPGASLAQHLTYYNRMLESKTPEADAVRPMVEALRDASLRVLPTEGATELTEEQIWGKKIDMWREADRIYKQRQSGK
jgi:hypothetical protein